MTEEQKKRRDELADRYRHKTNETEITITGTFKAGYEAGYADAKEEILKLKTALGVAGEFIKRNDELTRKLEVASSALKTIEDVSSAFSFSRNVSYTDWELRKIAGEALKELS